MSCWMIELRRWACSLGKSFCVVVSSPIGLHFMASLSCMELGGFLPQSDGLHPHNPASPGALLNFPTPRRRVSMISFVVSILHHSRN